MPKSRLCLYCGNLTELDCQHNVQSDNQLREKDCETAFEQATIEEQQFIPAIETTLVELVSVKRHCSYCNSDAVMPKSGLCLDCGNVTEFDNKNKVQLEKNRETVFKQAAIKEQQDIPAIKATVTEPVFFIEDGNQAKISLFENTGSKSASGEGQQQTRDFEISGYVPASVVENSGSDSTEGGGKALNIETAANKYADDINCFTSENPFLFYKGKINYPLSIGNSLKLFFNQKRIIESCKHVFDQLKEKLFSKGNNYNSPDILPVCCLVEENISMDVVKKFFPIRNYDHEKLLAFISDLKSEVFPKQTTLFQFGDKTESAFYLLKGTVFLLDEKGKISEIMSGTEKAKFPVSSGAIHTTTAITKTDVSVLRVSQNILSRKYAPISSLSTLVVPNELTNNHLMSSFVHHYNNEELEIPSLPDVAFELRKAMQSDVGITEIVKTIQLDPVISSKLIGLANSPLFVNVTPVKSCFEAVNRIGLNATRNFVISLSLNRVFKNNSPLIKKYAVKNWKQSLYISKLSHVLATISKQVNPEKALLAGLICDIGVIPFLSFASKFPKEYCSESDIELILPYVKGPVGYKILNDWGFSEEFLKVTLDSENWDQNSSEELNLTDIVVLSRRHSKIGQLHKSRLPTITSIPAAGKFKNLSLSPDISKYMLYKANQQVNEAWRR